MFFFWLLLYSHVSSEEFAVILAPLPHIDTPIYFQAIWQFFLAII